MPASATPSNVRAAVRPANDSQNAMHMVIRPKQKVINDSHMLGPNFLQRILVGL